MAPDLRSGLKRLLAVEEIGVIVALLALGLALTLTTDTFFTAGNLAVVARQASSYGIMAVGMAMLLAMGEIDLSVGSISALVAVAAALALRAGWPVGWALAAGVATGAGCGLVNGLLSVGLRIPTIIVTLGTMNVFHGLALVVSGATAIDLYEISKSHSLFKIGEGDFFGVPTGVVGMILVGAAGYVLLNHTAFGWRIQAIGSNQQAARFSGIAISRHRILAMTLMGAICSVAGLLAMAFDKGADPANGPGVELSVIAAAIVGGTPLAGGSGSVPGAILGALIIAVIQNGLLQWKLPTYWSTTATGAVIILAVAIGNLVKRR